MIIALQSQTLQNCHETTVSKWFLWFYNFLVSLGLLDL